MENKKMNIEVWLCNLQICSVCSQSLLGNVGHYSYLINKASLFLAFHGN